MAPTLALIFALIAGVAQVISILGWLKIGPDKIFNRAWWKVREVTVTKGKLAIISVLGLLSLGLSAYGLFLINSERPVPKMMQWGVGNKHCNVVVDTTAIKQWANDYYLVLACGVVDPTVDILEEKRIMLSGPFNIYGSPQAISAASNPDFDKFMESFGSGIPLSFWQRVFLIPRERDVSEVHKLSDVPRIKGKLF